MAKNFWDEYTTIEQKTMWEAFRTFRTLYTILGTGDLVNKSSAYISMSRDDVRSRMMEIADALNLPDFVRNDAGVSVMKDGPKAK